MNTFVDSFESPFPIPIAPSIANQFKQTMIILFVGSGFLVWSPGVIGKHNHLESPKLLPKSHPSCHDQFLSLWIYVGHIFHQDSQRIARGSYQYLAIRFTYRLTWQCIIFNWACDSPLHKLGSYQLYKHCNLTVEQLWTPGCLFLLIPVLCGGENGELVAVGVESP